MRIAAQAPHTWSAWRRSIRQSTSRRTLYSLLLTRLVHRDRVDGNFEAGRLRPEPRRRACRGFDRERLLVRLVHRLEVVRVLQVDRRPHDGLHGETKFLEDRADVRQTLPRLPAHVRGGPFPGLGSGLERRLGRDEDEVSRDDAGRVRAEGLRMIPSGQKAPGPGEAAAAGPGNLRRPVAGLRAPEGGS